MGKYYAVKNGRETGLFLTWAECCAQVKGYKGAVYKSFTSKEEALIYLEDKPKQIIHQDGLIAYVDGSYNVKTNEYAYGCVLIDHQEVILQLNGKDHHQDYVSMRNVAGEIKGSEVAIQYAIDHHYPMICIYYDYEGIEKWANHEWNCNKKGTQEYQRFIDESRKSIEIVFMKVLAHSGDYYNEMADHLAKKALGIS